jgi:hypothetical protein
VFTPYDADCPLTVALLLLVTRDDVQTALVRLLLHMDHCAVRLKPQPLDCEIPLLHRLAGSPLDPVTAMESIHCPDEVVGPQVEATGCPFPQVLVVGPTVYASRTERGLFMALLRRSTNCICICRM